MGREVRSFMTRLVRGETVICQLNGDRRYDQWVGVCFSAGRTSLLSRSPMGIRSIAGVIPAVGIAIWRLGQPGPGSGARGIVDDGVLRHHHIAMFACGWLLRQRFQRGGRPMIRYVFAITGFALIGSMALAQGTPTPEAGLVVDAAAVPFSEAVVNGAFMRLSEDERYVLQQRLERRGFYQGTVDGLTGPGTREAIREQAAAVLSAGQEVRLDTEEGARTFLMGLLPMPAEELPEGDAFFGVWDCGMGQFSYRYDGYATDPDASHIPYMAIEAFSPGTFGVTLMDGYRMGVFDVTPTTLTWSSPASGDTFECRWVGPAPSRPPAQSEMPTSAPEVPDVGIMEAVALPEGKAEPVQSVPEAAATEAPLQVARWPFEGDWSCLSGTFGNGPMDFQFGPDSVTVPVIGSTVGYADVTKIGGRETAYLVNLLDGQQAGLLEIEPERMILAAAGSLFDCSRETQP